VLGTQQTSCIVIAGLLKRDSFDLLLPEFDKPWVIHLRETCYGSTNLCTWRPNIVYKDRSVRRHHSSYLPLGVPNWAVIYTPSSNFFGTVAREKEDFWKGSLSLPIFYFVIVFFCLHLFIKNTKKLVPL
jgi:hypothetical protein